MTIFNWMRELTDLAYAYGRADLIGMYHYHLQSYKAGLTPPDELKLLIEKEED